MQIVPADEPEEESGPVSQLEIFVPTETRNEPYSKYAKDYDNFEELQKKGIIPVVNGNSIGDCCYRDDIRSDAGRIFPKGTYAFYYKTNNPRVLGGWDVHSETCSLVVFDLPYDYAIQNKNFLISFIPVLNNSKKFNDPFMSNSQFCYERAMTNKVPNFLCMSISFVMVFINESYYY